MATIGAVCTFVIVLVAGTIWRGYVLSVLWAWFVVATFHAPALSIPAAIGLSLVVTSFNPDGQRQEGDGRTLGEALAQFFFINLFGGLMVLAVGWVIKIWMPA